VGNKKYIKNLGKKYEKDLLC